MKFQVLPTIPKMIEYYRQPRSMARFQAYLKLLSDPQYTRLELPVVVYNPMGKEHVLEQLLVLQHLEAEAIAANTLAQWARQWGALAGPTFAVSLGLADDLQGGWTNRFTTHYQGTFQLKSMVDRGFCVPIFWSSETLSKPLIGERVLAQAWRTVYQYQQGSPLDLAAHLAQEVWVARQLRSVAPELDSTDLAVVEAWVQRHAKVEHAPQLLPFFYGDAAAEALGYPPLGLPLDGFTLAQYRATY